MLCTEHINAQIHDHIIFMITKAKNTVPIMALASSVLKKLVVQVQDDVRMKRRALEYHNHTI